MIERRDIIVFVALLAILIIAGALAVRGGL